MNIKEILPEWKQYKLQIIGAACLAAAWIIWLIHGHYERLISAGLLLFCLLIDVYVSSEGWDTITQWIRRQFGERIDLLITIGMFIITCIAVLAWQQPFHPHDIWLGCAIYAIKGHLFLTQ